MITIKISKISHFTIHDRQINLFFAASFVKVTGSNKYIHLLADQIKEGSENNSWIELSDTEDSNYTSVNCYNLESEEPIKL